MISDIFNTKKYDKEVFLIYKKKPYTLYEIKEIISYYAELLKDKDENIVILPNNNFNFIISFLSGIFGNKNIILITDEHRLNEIDEKYTILEVNPNNKIKNYELKKPDIKKPFVTFFTSGSTGEPKRIKKSLFNLISEGKDIIDELSIKDKKLIVSSTTTMCHLFGLTFHFFFSICGRHIINTDSITYPEELDIENCFLITTPSFLNIIKRHSEEFKINPLYIASAGSKLPKETFKYIEEKSKVIEIYGSTETGVIGYKKNSNNCEFTIFPNVEITNKGDDFFIKTNYSINENIKLDDNIELHNNKILVKDRKDRIIKIYDKRISTMEIEKILSDNPYISQSYCFKKDEKLAAFLTLTDEGKDFLIKNGVLKLKKELKDYAKQKTDIIPQKWRFSDEIPTNKTGKIDKDEIDNYFNINCSMPIILNREIKTNEITYSLFFHKNCGFYEGHFPDFPITPGVAQLYLATSLGSSHFKMKLGIGQIKKIKFSNIMPSDSIVNLKLELQEKYVCFKYYKGDIVYSGGNLPYENTLRNGDK